VSVLRPAVPMAAQLIRCRLQRKVENVSSVALEPAFKQVKKYGHPSLHSDCGLRKSISMRHGLVVVQMSTNSKRCCNRVEEQALGMCRSGQQCEARGCAEAHTLDHALQRNAAIANSGKLAGVSHSDYSVKLHTDSIVNLYRHKHGHTLAKRFMICILYTHLLDPTRCEIKLVSGSMFVSSGTG
jgi:hypothetical protein